MNWTEGALARHSRGRARNALIARQKQHFAKARANLLNNQTQQHSIAVSFLPPDTISASPQRDHSSRGYHDEQPTPLRFMQGAARRENPTYLLNNTHPTGYTDLEKRRRLLEKSDWAGLHLQEPLDISFPGQIYATRRWTRPSEITPTKYVHPAAVCKDKPRGLLKKPSMRIRIGSQDIQQSHATGSQSSIKRYPQEFDHYTHGVEQDFASESSHHTRSRCEHDSHGLNTALSDAPKQSSGGPETPINVVYSSSVIHEPAPRRDSKFPLLQWSSPRSDDDDGQSMQVEVEQPTRPVPSSQESEQRIWESWPSEKGDSNIPCNSVLSTDSESNIPLPPHLQLRLPSLDLSSESRNSPRPLAAAGTDTDNIIKGAHLCMENKPSSRNEKSHMSRKQPNLSDDLNAIWMKFAYGDDLDSEEFVINSIKQAARQAAVQLRPSETSGSVDEDIRAIETGETNGSSADYQHTSDIGFSKPSPDSHVATQGTEQSSVDFRHTNDVTSADSSMQSHVATQGTEASGSSANYMATIGLSDEPPRSTARFTMPKPFVGKRVGAGKNASHGVIITDISRRTNEGRHNRRKRKAMDGRTDIRSLPDFDEDPIEELQDD